MLNGTAEVPTLNVVPHTIKLITINMENTTKTPDQAKHPGRMKPYIYIYSIYINDVMFCFFLFKLLPGKMNSPNC